MPETYTPSAVDHATVDLPLPGEDVKTAGITPSIKRDMDRDEYTRSVLIAAEASARAAGDSAEASARAAADATIEGAMTLQMVEFLVTASNAWTVPPGVNYILCDVTGAGGGGAGGAVFSGLSSDNFFLGGGGGGRGMRHIIGAAVTPGQGIDINVGVGGPGGALGAVGTDGTDATVQINGGAVIARARGGQGGSAPIAGNFSTSKVWVPGGNAPAGVAKRAAYKYSPATTPSLATPNELIMPDPVVGEGGGGFAYASSVANVASADGGSSREGSAGGAGGTRGNDLSTSRGGGGGGGGGGGAWGVGGAGGIGGAGSNVAAGGNGTPGSSAAANSGAGGGGGAAGGEGQTLAGVGAIGGDGGSGRVRIYFLAPP